MDETQSTQAVNLNAESSSVEGNSAVNTQPPKSLKIPVIIGGVVVFVTIVTAGLVLISENSDLLGNITGNNQATSLTSAIGLELVDGIYYTEVSYYVPAAEKTDYLGVTLIVKDNKVVSALGTSLEADGTPAESKYQTEFNEKVSTEVNGKNFESAIEFANISGSTLTTDAFRQALQSLQSDAKAGLTTDGKYYTEVDFYVPAAERTHTLGVTVEIEDGLVSAVKAADMEEGEEVESKYMLSYTETITELVVGKKLTEIDDLVMVSGSTLTSEAFQSGLQQLRLVEKETIAG